MPQGHGHATSYAQIVGSVLQLPMDDIDVVQGDTDRVPFGHGTFNSRSMVVGGTAAHNAAQKVLAKAKLIAATLLDSKPEHVSYARGMFSVAGESQASSLSFGQVARMAYVSSDLPL